MAQVNTGYDISGLTAGYTISWASAAPNYATAAQINQMCVTSVANVCTGQFNVGPDPKRKKLILLCP